MSDEHLDGEPRAASDARRETPATRVPRRGFAGRLAALALTQGDSDHRGSNGGADELLLTAEPYLRALVRSATDVRASSEHLRDVERVGHGFATNAEGLPIDARGWSRWYDRDYQPAAARLDSALVALEDELEVVFPDWGTEIFLDVCRALLRRDEPDG
ncbi:MAG: hypothetical protein ACRCYQ_12725 [Nocardioides sp.]